MDTYPPIYFYPAFTLFAAVSVLPSKAIPYFLLCVFAFAVCFVGMHMILYTFFSWVVSSGASLYGTNTPDSLAGELTTLFEIALFNPMTMLAISSYRNQGKKSQLNEALFRYMIHAKHNRIQ